MGTETQPQVQCDVKDLALADVGKRRIEWAVQSMPVLQTIRKQFIKKQPLAGMRVAACLHVTTETANLMIALRDGGADGGPVRLQPAFHPGRRGRRLVKDYGIPVFAIKGEDERHLLPAHHAPLPSTGRRSPWTTARTWSPCSIPSGRTLAGNIIGGTEETTTGVIRLRAMAKEGVLKYPIIAVNDALTKHLFDNRYGTGQSTLDGIIRATNVLLAGMNLVVAGYGWCGRGVAMRARGMGANVIVTEIDPTKPSRP